MHKEGSMKKVIIMALVAFVSIGCATSRMSSGDPAVGVDVGKAASYVQKLGVWGSFCKLTAACRDAICEDPGNTAKWVVGIASAYYIVGKLREDDGGGSSKRERPERDESISVRNVRNSEINVNYKPITEGGE